MRQHSWGESPVGDTILTETGQAMQTLGYTLQEFCRCSFFLTGNNNEIIKIIPLIRINVLHQQGFFVMIGTNGDIKLNNITSQDTIQTFTKVCQV